MLVALGIGVMFTLTVYLLQESLLKEVASAAPPGMPNVYLINITQREHDGVARMLEALPNLKKKPTLEPLVAVRLVSVRWAKRAGSASAGLRTSPRGHADGDVGGDAADGSGRAQRRLVARHRHGPTGGRGGGDGATAAHSSGDEASMDGGRRRLRNARRGDLPPARGAQRPQMELLFNRPALAGLPTQYVGQVRLHTTYNVSFRRLDGRHGYSISRSTKISEIDSPGTHSERALKPTRSMAFSGG